MSDHNNYHHHLRAIFKLLSKKQSRQKSRVHGAIGFGSTSHWLKNWRQSCEPVIKRSNRNRVITFDSHLKIALIINNYNK